MNLFPNSSSSDAPPPGSGAFVPCLGETCYRIAHVDQLPPFLMSLVSASDHWLFIASNGGLTAGRVDADSALFPYETEDKLADHHELSGGKTLLRVTRHGRSALWEPFSDRTADRYRCERHLYKTIPGNQLLFEEINHDLGLTLRTAWRTGDRFGFIRTCWLINHGAACEVALLDGLLNLMPANATARLQTTFSSLLNAYKRSECDPATGLGIFALSATLTDRAEPSESLQATVAWQLGLDAPLHLLSRAQLDAFRHGRSLTPESDVRGQPAAYLTHSRFTLPPAAEKQWHVVADVRQDSAAVVRLQRLLAGSPAALAAQLEADVAANTAALVRAVAAADGLQHTADPTLSAHHFANVLFNIMRGGIFHAGYRVDRADLLDFFALRSRAVSQAHAAWLAALPASLPITDLYARAAATSSPDLIRLCHEYLPLTFSRRHGDPSRPWNHFTINLKHADGTPRLDYQGNWRDIFQNWEPLALAFPGYVTGMIARFLNATTADGYNPYRVTRAGIEWEEPEPDNPWANIGYWNDHQIIYLQKLLEIAAQAQPDALARLWQRPVFAYANVPYRLRPYDAMLADWYNTVDFDDAAAAAINTAVSTHGTDARLQRDAAGHVVHVSLTEKLLVLLLAKLTNLVPGGGIWMNTQRPEWNDANNALVGKGLSVVTTAYLRRFVAFWQAQLAASDTAAFAVNAAVADLFGRVQRILQTFAPHLDAGFDAAARRALMDDLGAAATAYRAAVYADGIPAAQAELPATAVSDLLALAQAYLDHTLHASRRPDGLYHAYNVLRLGRGTAAVDHLYLMLEGQVAILSAGILPPAEALALLHALRRSSLYRADQHSYMLYPNRQLPGFLAKNNVPAERVTGLRLVAALAEAGDPRLLVRDEAGAFHFNGRFRNATDVAAALDALAQEPPYAAAAAAERAAILDLFEETFNHHAFTGRSGTFFAYEGLGSIYWHMVAKLLLAVQECHQQAAAAGAPQSVVAGLAAAYADVRAGLGFNKTPAAYGAFPTDPYSHTPFGSGARQPGMTGQVKEEILTRWGELGVSLHAGALRFAPALLSAAEFAPEAASFTCVDLGGETRAVPLPPDSLAFTVCQTPVVYTLGDTPQVEVIDQDGRVIITPGCQLDLTTTRHVLNRDGHVRLIRVQVRPPGAADVESGP